MVERETDTNLCTARTKMNC